MLFEQIHTTCLNDADLPWVPFTPYSERVLVKYFKLDPVRGEVIALMKAPPRGEMPRHRHTGTVIVHTVQGRWKYREHDWIAAPGSIVYETAGSSHTPEALADDAAQDDIVTLNIIQGELLFVNERGQVLASENWKTGWDRYAAYCQANGIEARDLTAFG
ncbi:MULTISPECIES: 2,4'-dihydroxyacetophenone dioxygenase family protein [unclassified Caballeronia]|uniref:2,4'-dihydroxyacetophenone dioxygenase family protein n=1 Tax=unclassified Caballeronia TaxID=2646786 RepID=UPI0028577D4A|nr:MULTISPECIES: 2,4'-dihydroxyacetophenone dioxygenase family protein [unclassified Caballeronia]MDR5818370.1 2,4'-dihydroxyacetophenone dioxygenase family protein [Caballeronia sp. LZ033]MDR5825338.1 2,4'-dihydroxyacetophenone dioxygenase family protein [Caballeronia sp. LZ043]